MYEIRLIYNDNAIDHRGGSHTDFIVLLIRDNEGVGDRIANLIKQNPEVLIGLYNQVFPNFNRYGNKLVMDDKKFHIFKY